jgi:hypothetical protein
MTFVVAVRLNEPGLAWPGLDWMSLKKIGQRYEN